MEVAELSFDIVQATDFFCEGSLESVRVRVELERSQRGASKQSILRHLHLETEPDQLHLGH